MTFKQLCAQLHLWLGLASGLIVFLVSLSGCIYVFQDELTSAFYRDARYVAPPEAVAPIAPSQVFAAAKAKLPSDLESIYYVDYTDPRRVHGLWARDSVERHWHAVWINPYSGEVTRTYRWLSSLKEDFFGVTMAFHTTLLLGDTGHQIVAASTIIFIIALITGIVLWIPRSWRTLRARLIIKLDSKPKRLNWDLHSVLGFYTSWILLLIAFTGLVWAYPWFNQAVYWISTGGKPKTEIPEWVAPESTPEGYNNVLETLDHVYPKIRDNFPEANRFMIEAREDMTKPIRIVVHQAQSEYNQTTYFFDPSTGEQVFEHGFQNLNRGEKIRALNWDLHTGQLWGLPTKILAFLASLTAASLPVTGFLIWFPRWKQKRKRKKAKALKA